MALPVGTQALALAPECSPSPSRVAVSGLCGILGSASNVHLSGKGGTQPPVAPREPLLGLDARPQHVLPLDHVGVLPDELPVVRQDELPASVDPHHGHVLQKVLHILRTELGAGQG